MAKHGQWMTGPVSSNEEWPTRPIRVEYALPLADFIGPKDTVIDSMASSGMTLAPIQVHSAIPGSAESPRGNVAAERVSANSGSPNKSKRRCVALRRRIRPFVESNMFKGVIIVSLFIALVGNPLVEIFDVPDEPCNTIVNVIMLFILVLFAVEIVLNYISNPIEYNLCKFFFWMDVLGTFSMFFEISWFPLSAVGRTKDASSGNSFDTVLLRTARFAKVGARVGRLHRGLKTFWAVIMEPSGKTRPEQQEMRNVSYRLMIALSTKVSVLTIIFVFCLPLFNMADFPTNDLSGLTWIHRLEADYSRAFGDARKNNGTSQMFAQSVKDMQEFYADYNYEPWRIKGFPSIVPDAGGSVLKIPGEFDNGEPNRLQDVEWHSVENCRAQRSGCTKDDKASVGFDLGRPHRIEAGLDIGMFVFIIFVMVVLSYDIQRSVNQKVVEPLERMIAKVRDVASRFLKISVDQNGDASAGNETAQLSETDLLEAVISKLTKLTEIMVKEHVATYEEMANMDHTTLGVLSTILRLPVDNIKRATIKSGNRSAVGHQDLAVKEMSMKKDILDSWRLDVLELDRENLEQLVLYVFFDSHLGHQTGRSFTTSSVFKEFHQQARDSYNDMPYHCYQHACDILHTMYRIMTLTSAHTWMRDHEQYALLVAALCHDLGHFGLTNQFLVESRNELALGYNDNSPLENMHCAKMFKICNKDDANIFAKMELNTWKEVRKICISAILHTDNAHHFDMCKEIESFGVRMNDACEEAAAASGEGCALPEAYKQEVLAEKAHLWMNLFLHVCDVSNPLKPFDVCFKWAHRVLDEFFQQGDEEKRLGLPVGMLNDREKVNRPGSQHGFINFLVAPLVKHTVKLFPPLHELTFQMASNLGEWRNLWVKEVNPSNEEIAKRDKEINGWSEVATQLQNRVMPKSKSA